MKTLLIFLGTITAISSPALSSSAEDSIYQNALTSSALLPSAKHNSMAIDPKFRASDYKEAFELLRKEKAPNKVCVKLVDGSIVSNIIEMNLMANNTVFLLRYNSPKGIKVQAVELEQIHGIGYIE